MADEFSFVETDSAKIYTTIIESLMDACNEALYPGDERRIFAEAMVQVLVSVFALFDDRAKQRTLRHARGYVLDALGERYDVYRLEPSTASAVFRFTASDVRDTNIIIPQGTRITTDGSVYFETTAAVVLQAGELTVDVEGVCTEGGSEYNGFAAGAIAAMVDLIPFISSAVNITASSGGDDGEPYTTEGDDRLRERILLAPSTLSTAGPESGYRYWALTADADIVDVAIDCPEDEPNTVNLYPLMTGGALPDEDTLAKVLEACNADKRRPMTDLVQAFAPEPVDFAIEIKYYCTKDNEAATIQTVESAGGSIDQYLEWQTTKLGRDVNPDQLRRFCFAPESGTGALRMDVIQPTLQALHKWQIARFTGEIAVSHEVVLE